MTLTLNVNDRLKKHFAGFAGQLSDLRDRYKTEHYIEIDPFVPEDLQAAAHTELEALFAANARRRDLIVAQSGNTPRRYSNIDRDAIHQDGGIIPAIYRAPALYELLESIVGERVLPVPYTPEEYIASRLHEPNDVHGWHWDDYTWAIVWVFKMPPAEHGGSLEYIKDAPWDRENPQPEKLVAQGPVWTRHPGVGAAYLLKADTALHRVKPLSVADERMIVCYSFATEADLQRPVDHSSMAALYPESHARHED
ncbi:HalD/BesD family halogenase [Micromonospora inyonensis]|uniref:2OG-Fe(II) oxygenase superfamily protein n=1 Tax=Micromonospora inyonensis TaxID=47866 RepID=A0A1C6RLU1_9ACTN|nr:hypothetical protein [Micromonospora inyonensis]SCL18089.1 2OG-Fe(II) oxygenase superfamily protein [Micromonospora inyonensis]